MTYPDSVSRVRPPKTTMPKTLAALPINQYATPLELVLGQFVFPVTESSWGTGREDISRPSFPRGEEGCDTSEE